MTAVEYKPTETEVANRFIWILRNWFAKDKKMELTSELVANANDYFDANMAMDEAMTDCGSKLAIESQEFCDLFNAAWAKAIELMK